MKVCSLGWLQHCPNQTEIKINLSNEFWKNKRFVMNLLPNGLVVMENWWLCQIQLPKRPLDLQYSMMSWPPQVRPTYEIRTWPWVFLEIGNMIISRRSKASLPKWLVERHRRRKLSSWPLFLSKNSTHDAIKIFPASKHLSAFWTSSAQRCHISRNDF